MRLGAMTPELTHELDIQKLFDAYPDLRKHRCESGRHRSFFDEARQTETAHLLEHVAVELLALSGVSRDKARGQTGIPQGEKRNFYRLRLGIGRPPYGNSDTINWVLGRFNAEEQAVCHKVLPAAGEVMRDFVLDGPAKAIRAANNFTAMPSGMGIVPG